MFFETPMLGRSNVRQPKQITRAASDTTPVAPSQKQVVAAENRFGEDCLAILHQHYPSHYWDVVVDFSQGIAAISIPILMGPTAKYILHLDLITTLSAFQQEVKKAGGEILERWRIPRGSLDLGLGQFLKARENRLTLPNQAMPT